MQEVARCWAGLREDTFGARAEFYTICVTLLEAQTARDGRVIRSYISFGQVLVVLTDSPWVYFSHALNQLLL